jgi:hypothetical protein
MSGAAEVVCSSLIRSGWRAALNTLALSSHTTTATHQTTNAERHISVDPHELKMAIKNRLELEDRHHFDDLCKLMEGVANFDFYDLKQR